MGWFALSAVMACLCFACAWMVGRARRGGADDRLLSPLISIPAGLVVALSVPLVVARTWSSVPWQQWGVPALAWAVLTLAFVAVLVVLWWMARRPVDASRCTACGHQLRDGQIRCPECGTERSASADQTVRQRLERITQRFPYLVGLLVRGQTALLFVAFVGLACLVVPTVRLVTVNRMTGDTSGMAIPRTESGARMGAGSYAYHMEVDAKIVVPATFLMATPWTGADLGLEVKVNGEVKATASSGEALAPCSLDMAHLIQSRSDLIAFQNDLAGRTSLLNLNDAQDPATTIYESFDVFARGYWPPPDPTGKTPPPAMPTADIAKAPTATTPAVMVFGVPFAVGATSFVMALLVRRSSNPLPVRQP